jgi:hypothetical protein
MMANMPPEAMQGMDADMMDAMPPEAMQGMDASMMDAMPADAMGGMCPQHMETAAIHVGNGTKAVSIKDGEHLVSQVKKQKNLETLNSTLTEALTTTK